MRTLIFVLSVVPAYLVARFLDDDFPDLTRERSLLSALGLFLWCTKWALASGVAAYLLLYALVGSPFSLRGQIALLATAAVLGGIGPVLLFDVAWFGGPLGVRMSVWPTLYRDMRPLFILCGVVFHLFYLAAFALVRDPREEATVKPFPSA